MSGDADGADKIKKMGAARSTFTVSNKSTKSFSDSKRHTPVSGKRKNTIHNL
jgi:hypothetical protein